MLNFILLFSVLIFEVDILCLLNCRKHKNYCCRTVNTCFFLPEIEIRQHIEDPYCTTAESADKLKMLLKSSLLQLLDHMPSMAVHGCRCQKGSISLDR